MKIKVECFDYVKDDSLNPKAVSNKESKVILSFVLAVIAYASLVYEESD